MRILIAEDDPVSQRLLQRTLEKLGHEVQVAGDGEQAWQQFIESEVNFVITDWMMPGVDGVELVRRIRARETRHYVYIIMLTAKTQREDLVEGMEAGADDFVSKPFDRDELRVRIEAGQRLVRLESQLAEQNTAMRRDLEAAAAVQRSLLPQSPPRIEGFHFGWAFTPTEFVAGDIFNVHRLDERTVGMYVLDVSGHGVPAAMLSVTLSRLLQPSHGQDSLVKHSIDAPPHYQIVEPRDVLGSLNERFPMESQNNLYHTVIYALLDTETRQMTISRAGHPYPILTRRGGSQILRDVDGGLPAGMCSGIEYGQTVIDLEPGDRVYLFSDGIIEAAGESGEMFGDGRLADTLAEAHALPISETIEKTRERVLKIVGSSTFEDDLTLLGVEVV